MKIAIIGGGVSGVTFAINRKRNHPNDEIFIFEHITRRSVTAKARPSA